MGEFAQLAQQTVDGTAVLVDTPYGRALQFMESPVEPDKRTPMTEADLDDLSAEFIANRDKWPEGM